MECAQLGLNNVLLTCYIAFLPNVCPGVLSKGHVRCPWHGACFNVTTGDIEDFPGLDSLPVFQVNLSSVVLSDIIFSAWCFSFFVVLNHKRGSDLFFLGQS